MFFDNALRVVHHKITGPAPTVWYGVNAIDGDAYPWVRAPLGSIYMRKTGAVNLMFQKVKNDGADNDWVALQGTQVVAETVALADFTDGGAAVGTYTMSHTIPVGALFYRAVVVNVTGFAGDTSAVLTVGDGTDVDRYNATTVNVFADAVALDGGVPSGTLVHTAAKTPVLTVTAGSDWGAVTAGQMTVKLFYFL